MANAGPVAVVWLVVCVSLCAARNLTIRGYPNGVIDVHENSNSRPVVCGVHGDQGLPYRSRFKWTVVTDSKTSLYLGRCYDFRFCRQLHENISLDAGFGRTELVINNIQRNMSGRLTCYEMGYRFRPRTDYRLLNVYHLPTVDDCNVDITRHNWTAKVSCDISNAFSSADMYTFLLHEAYISNVDSNDTYSRTADCMRVETTAILDEEGNATVLHRERTFTEKTEGSSRFKHCIFHGPVPYHQLLNSYINSTDNQVYYRGRLEHSWKLSPYPADNLTIRISVCTGSTVETCATSDHRLSAVSLPSTPRHNCTDLAYIPATGGPRCVCTAEDLGSPAGRLVWMSGDVTLAAGDYGVRQLLLPAGTLPRGQDGGQVVCRLDWSTPDPASPRLETAFTETGGRHTAETDGEKGKWAGIGAAAMLAAGVVVSLMVILAIWVCRRVHPCANPMYDSTKPRGQQRSNNVTESHLYEVMTTSNPKGRSLPAVPDSSNEYENTSFSQP